MGGERRRAKYREKIKERRVELREGCMKGEYGEE